ncbi:MAG TPA: PEGA domain-containing protein [Gammaproteobacteria bacterium]|jgi:hypothetical protein
MKRIAMAVGFSSLLALAGCATLFGGGSHQKLTFDSAPEGAAVFMNGQQLGVTPLNVDVPREKGVVFSFKKDGYITASVVADTHLNPWFWGDVIATSLLSTTVDTATNSSVKYSEDRYFVTLTAVGTGPDAAARRNQVSSYIVTNYGAIGVDFSIPLSSKSNTQGEHIVALADMVALPGEDGDRLPTLNVLHDLYTSTHSAPDFANAVLSKFGLN